MSVIDQIDFCIKAYLRPSALDRLCGSIRHFYPDAEITINETKALHVGRNLLVERTKRPFVLFMDDDLEFTADTKVELLLEQMADPKVGAVGGRLLDWQRDGTRVERNSGGRMKIEGRTLFLDADLRTGPAFQCDCLPIFFLCRREVFPNVQWRWGVGSEHADFFLQLKRAGWLSLLAPEVAIDHHPFSEALPGYKAARWDIERNMTDFMDAWQIDRVIVNGKAVHVRPC